MPVSGRTVGDGVSAGGREIVARVVSVALLSALALTGCSNQVGDGSGGPGDPQDDLLFASAPDVLWGIGHLGYGPTGKLLLPDRYYVADMEGDGQQELIIYTSYGFLQQLQPSPIMVFTAVNGTLNNVTEDVFPDGPPSAVGNRDLHFADMNDDGQLDLFLSNQGTEALDPFPGEQNGLYLSNGHGQWFDATETHLPQILDFSHGSSVSDIDGDGRVEIHVLNLGGGENPGSYLLRQDDHGHYVKVADTLSNGNGVYPSEIIGKDSGFFSTFADVNSDGAVDLFLGPLFDVVVAGEWAYGVLLNDGNGSFSLADPETLPLVREFEGFEPAAPLPEAILVGDINGDERDDIVAFARYGDFKGSFFVVLVNQVDGALADETKERLPEQTFDPIETSVPQAHLIDVDADGDLDLVASAFDWSTSPDGDALISWHYLNDGSGNFHEWLNLPVGSGPGRAFLDADGDGDLDLVSEYRDWSSEGESYIAVFEGLSSD